MKLNTLANDAHNNALNKGFYDKEISIMAKMHESGIFSDDEMKTIKNAFRCTKLLLIVSEVTECMDALRNNKFGGGVKDTFESEGADIIIRTGDFFASENVDLEKSVDFVMKNNLKRDIMHGGKEF